MKELLITIIYREGTKEKQRVRGLAPDITEAEIAEMGQTLTKIFCPEWSSPLIRRIEIKIIEGARRKKTSGSDKPKRKERPTPDPSRVKEVKLPTISQMNGWSPKTAAKHQMRYIKEDLSDKKRIDQTLINIQIEEAFASSDLLAEKKPLSRESHQELLSLIFNREDWTPQMLSAFHQLKHLLRSNEKNRLRRGIRSMNWRLRNEYLGNEDKDSQRSASDEVEIIITTQEIIQVAAAEDPSLSSAS